MYPNQRDELDLFKSQINLTEYASAHGYVLDRKHSSRNNVAMRGPAGDKVIIARDARDGNWIYYSVTDDQDHGTIIDFITRRRPLNLGEVRKELQPWVGLAPTPPPRLSATAYQKSEGRGADHTRPRGRAGAVRRLYPDRPRPPIPGGGARHSPHRAPGFALCGADLYRPLS
jgi:hypothetical protein